MTVQDARDFAAALNAACDQAEAEGRDTITLAPLRLADDAARAELQAAIDAAR